MNPTYIVVPLDEEGAPVVALSVDRIESFSGINYQTHRGNLRTRVVMKSGEVHNCDISFNSFTQTLDKAWGEE